MENFLSRTREGVFIRVVASFGLVAGLAAVLSAQAPSSNGKAHQNGVHSIRVHVIGCVRGDAEPGRYILTGTFLSGDDTPPTVGTAGKLGSGKDLSFENSHNVPSLGRAEDTPKAGELAANPCRWRGSLFGVIGTPRDRNECGSRAR